MIPVYDMNGRTITPEKKKREKRLAISLLILAFLIAFIYLPGFFLTDSSNDTAKAVVPDSSAIRLSNTALRDNQQEDFDGDGLTNAEESDAGTNAWNADTDGDGATDYYELKISDTDPLTANDLLTDEQTKLDRENEKKVGSPYKIGNVILWADDYQAKSHGSVVETTTGYRFNAFSGYAQFPAEDGKYAYQLENGVRTLLPYREAENAWRIDGNTTVELYDKQLEEIVEFNFFFHPVYAPSNIATDVLAVLLPDRGLITAEKKMKMDVEPDTRENVVIDIEKPIFDSTDPQRFTMNSNTLNDLLFVRETIKEEQCCVAVSLFNAEYGEYLAIIYGYTYEGDLLLADMNSLEPIGVLDITENARKILDESGDILSMSYFDFSGFGFNSQNGDRISFFAASSSSITGDQPSGFGNASEDSNQDKTTEEEQKTEDSDKDMTTLESEATQEKEPDKTSDENTNEEDSNSHEEESQTSNVITDSSEANESRTEETAPDSEASPE